MEANIMGELNKHNTESRFNTEGAEMIVRVANAAQVDAIICTTESADFVRHLHRLAGQTRVIAATANADTYHSLIQMDLEVIRLPLRAADKYKQIRHVISMAIRSARISIGERVLCTLAWDCDPDEENFAVLTDVEPNLEYLAVADLLKLTDGIRPSVLETAITVACKVGRAARRGKRIGTIFMLGDSIKVLAGSKQIIPNPFHGHDEAMRQISNADIHEALVELAKLDGAFVVRGDGLIQTAGTFLASASVEIEVPPGLGARHVAAAAVTKRSAATAVVVSATDGNVRVFSEGKLVLQIDPDVPDGPTASKD
jgi:DNA integrity scanning protein DisA with diadenylate cyclase activity